MDLSTPKPLNSLQILIMAASAGICVANVYYSQPILGAMAASLRVEQKGAGMISVLAQAGYGLGLFFITPIGDKVERKKLILWLQILLIGALLLITFSRNISMVYAGSLAVGMFSVVPQVIMPMAASLVTENRGKVVGLVFTGILVGVLGARVFSGFVTAELGWRYVYGISVGMVGISTILMQYDFPSCCGRFEGSYGTLLRSTFYQFRRFALLRRSAIIGALMFGALSAFWTTLGFYLSGPPFHFTTVSIGLFGLLAVAAALAAPVFGRLADRRHPKRTLLVTTSMMVLGVVCLKLFPFSVAGILVAIILLDIGVQATRITNVTLIYTLDAAAHSRINTVYMGCYFVGGSIGAFAGLWCWHADGWAGATWLMGAFSLAAVAVVAFSGQVTAKGR